MGKRALVMSGGGAKGSFELGAAYHLVNDKGLDFDVIAGVSVGSLNAVMLAQGRGLDGLRARMETLKDIWFGLRGNGDIYRERFLGEILALILTDSIYDPTPIRNKLGASVSEADLRGSGKEFRIGAVSLESGDYQLIKQAHGNIADWVMASSSMPLAFPPVRIGSEHWMDGGLRNITPLSGALAALKEAGGGDPNDPDELYVLLASALKLERKDKAWRCGREIAERGVEILVNEVYREDLSHTIRVNRSVNAYLQTERLLTDRGQLDDAARAVLERFDFRPPKYRPVRLYAVVPDRDYMKDLEFDPDKIRAAFAAGQKAAESPLDEAQLDGLVS